MTKKTRMMRTGLAGVIATVVDVVTLVTFVEHLGLRPSVAAFLAAAAGAAVGFCVAKYWAFGERGAVAWRQLARYALVAVGSALMLGLAMYALSERVGVPYLVSKALSAVVVFLCWSYPAQSRIVFRRSVVAPSLQGGSQ